MCPAMLVGGPDHTAAKLENGSAPIYEDMLESNHIEAATRMVLHVNAIKTHGEQNTAINQSSEWEKTLVFILNKKVFELGSSL